MVKVSFAGWAVVAALCASPAFAQGPQTGAAPAARPAATGPAPASPAPAQPAARAPLVDINHATKEELDVLPGVGPARAEAIIKGRPYKGKDELLRKKVIPSSVYEGIKDRIVARQS